MQGIHVYSPQALLAAPETGRRQPPLAEGLQDKSVLRESDHWKHALCWEPWLEHRCLQGETRTQRVVCFIVCACAKHSSTYILFTYTNIHFWSIKYFCAVFRSSFCFNPWLQCLKNTVKTNSPHLNGRVCLVTPQKTVCYTYSCWQAEDNKATTKSHLRGQRKHLLGDTASFWKGCQWAFVASQRPDFQHSVLFFLHRFY